MRRKISIALSLLMIASTLGPAAAKQQQHRLPARMQMRQAKPWLIPARPRLKSHFPVP